MKSDDSETRCKRVWFGVNARVTIGPGFQHRTGIGRLVIPHPALANWLLRLGLSHALRNRLTFAHEFAHFRTFPALLLYMLVCLVLLNAAGHIGIRESVLIVIGGQAAWEVMSEGLVILENAAAYRRAYAGNKKIPRIVFWTAGALPAGGLPILGLLFQPS